MHTPPDAHLREVLAETAESLLNRHLETAQEWHPHALIPWSAAEDFPEDYEWSPEEMKISAPVRSALFVNVLTEDNLPYYFRDIERMFGRDGHRRTATSLTATLLVPSPKQDKRM